MPEPNPRAGLIGMRASDIVVEVTPLPGELLYWIPAEGVWSIMDILCHIREFIPFWTAETLRIVRGQGDGWGRTHADEARLAAVRNTSVYRFQDVAEDIHQAVLQAADALGPLTASDFAVEAASVNPRWGVKSAGWVVDELLIHHLEKHLGQIRRNVEQHILKGEPSTRES